MELSNFLKKAKRRYFKKAVFAVHDDHTGLDIVRGAMFKLVYRHRDRPAAELTPFDREWDWLKPGTVNNEALH